MLFQVLRLDFIALNSPMLLFFLLTFGGFAFAVVVSLAKVVLSFTVELIMFSAIVLMWCSISSLENELI